MEVNHIKEILLDLRSLITCAICQEQLTNPRVLPCQHSFCLSCLKMLINSKSEDAQVSNPVSCPSCRQVTFLTSGGASRLPMDIKSNQIVGIIRTHQNRLDKDNIILSATTNVFDITDSDSDLESESHLELSHELLWCESSAEHIWDIDFMSDGSVLCASSSRVRLLSNVEGCDMHLGFDARLFHSPCSVASSGDTVVIVDWFKGNNEGFVMIMNRSSSNKWSTLTKQTPFQPNGIAMTPSGDLIVSGNDHSKDVDLLLCYNGSGEVIWCQSHPSDSLGPYLAIDNSSQLFISTPTKNSIDIYSMTGEHLSKFQADGVHEPRGLCFSSDNHIIIADQANRKVSMFDVNGSLIEHLVDFPGLPNSISLYEDRLLAVTDWQQKKLYLYELHK